MNFSSLSETYHRKGSFLNIVGVSDTFREFHNKYIRLQLLNIQYILHNIKLMIRITEFAWFFSKNNENHTACSHVSVRLALTILRELSYRRLLQSVPRYSKFGRYWTKFSKLNLKNQYFLL